MQGSPEFPLSRSRARDVAGVDSHSSTGLTRPHRRGRGVEAYAPHSRRGTTTTAQADSCVSSWRVRDSRSKSSRTATRNTTASTASDFDLVLTGVVMPGLSGYDLCRKIKVHPAKGRVPIVLLTMLHRSHGHPPGPGMRGRQLPHQALPARRSPPPPSLHFRQPGPTRRQPDPRRHRSDLPGQDICRLLGAGTDP